MYVATTTQILRIIILTISVCGLKYKLLMRDFVGYVTNYDVVCMNETLCDDAERNDR